MKRSASPEQKSKFTACDSIIDHDKVRTIELKACGIMIIGFMFKPFM